MIRGINGDKFMLMFNNGMDGAIPFSYCANGQVSGIILA